MNNELFLHGDASITAELAHAVVCNYLYKCVYIIKISRIYHYLYKICARVISEDIADTDLDAFDSNECKLLSSTSGAIIKYAIVYNVGEIDVSIAGIAFTEGNICKFSNLQFFSPIVYYLIAN